MGIQIGAKPDSGFDDPLGMLKDCHRRIEHFLGILCVVAERACDRSLTSEEASAINAALAYFQTGGQRHTADEEQSLFPRLIAIGAHADLERLESDHVEAGELHTSVEALYRSWLADGSLSEENGRRLLRETARLRALYETHIQVEDNVIFPRAAALLDQHTIDVIGQEFRVRRQ